jgi:hypothetical protein
MPEHKIGEGHVSAMGRQGLRELRGALYPESNIAQQPEYGLYGTLTPGEVAESRRGDDHGVDDEPKGKSIVDDRLQKAEGRVDLDDGYGPEMDVPDA